MKPPPSQVAGDKTLSVLFLLTVWFISLSSFGQTNVSGNQSGVWRKANSPYTLVGTVTVPANEVLTIEPGVEIHSHYYYDRILVNGTLLAKGTATDSIRFLGFANPGYTAASTHGGQIYFNSTSRNSVLEYVTIDRWGDKEYYNNAVYLGSASVSFTKSSIRNTEGNVIQSAVSDTALTISDNRFLNTGGIEIICYAANVDGIFNNPGTRISIQGGIVSKNSTWQHQGGTNSYYVINGAVTHNANLTIKQGVQLRLNGISITVGQNQTLTLEPGVEIHSYYYYDRILINGTLIAKGTATDSIRFLGFANPGYTAASTHGGQLYFHTTSRNSVLEYVTIDRWGDKDYYNNAVYLGSASVSFTKSSIRNSEALVFQSAVSDTSLTINRNTFSNNGGTEISCYAANLDSIYNNTNARILIHSSTVNRNTTWHRPGPNSQYTLNGGTYTIAQNITLTIEPGVEVRSHYYYDKLQVNGTLLARGTASDSIRFTGFANPGYTAASTHGGQLYFHTTSRNSVLEYVVLNNWGDKDYYNVAVQVASSSLSITKSNIRNTEGRVVLIENKDSVLISGNRFLNNGAAEITCYASNLDGISNNTNARILINSSTVGKNTVWPYPGSGSHYVLNGGSYTIAQNTTLTLEPGVEIHSHHYYDRILVNGTLLARGTASDSIRFTGFANPAYTAPSTHGGQIYFNSTSRNSILEFVTIDHWGDKDFHNNAVYLGSASVSITNSSFTNTEGNVIQSAVSDTSLTINNNTFQTTGGTEIICNATNLDGIYNNTNAKVLINSSTVNRNTTWHRLSPNSYYTLNGGTYTIAQNTTLTLEPGVVVRSFRYTDQITVNGTLIAQGTFTDSIRFLGFANPSFTAVSTHGGRLFFTGTSLNSVLEYVVIDRWGDKESHNAALQLASASLSMAKTSIRNSESNGLYYAANAPLTVSGSAFRNNNIGIYVASGKLVFRNCNMTGNTRFGINNTGLDTVDARNCWWGDATGPEHTTLNPAGKGDSVSNRVLFDPWRMEPVEGLFADIGVGELVSPQSDCRLAADATVTIRITNYGTTTRSGFPVGYQINNGNVVTENVGSLTLPPDSAVVYSFRAKANLAGIGSYSIKAFTALAADTIRNNDTLYTTVQHSQVIAAPGNLLPADSTTGLDVPVNFSWGAVANATAYDLYIWKASDTVPSVPAAANLTQISFSYSNNSLVYGTAYKWKVVAKHSTCQTASEVRYFTLRHLPDLTVSQITVPPTATSETDITVSWRITNSGAGTTGATRWNDLVYLSESLSNPFTNGLYLGSFTNLSALGPNQSYTSPSQNFRIPQGYQGHYYIVIKTNSTNSVRETVDTNNITVSAPIAISLAPPPDLQVSNLVVAPTTAFSEDSLSVSWTVENLGTGPTTATSWTDAVYLSADSVLNTGTAIFLGQLQRNGALPVNEEYTRHEKYKLPARLEGTYFVHVVTDRYLQVYEYVKEDNNIRTSTGLRIILRPAPNLIVSSVSVPYDTVSNKQNLKIDWIIKNDGAADARPGWTDNIRLTPDTVYSTSPFYNIGSYVHRDTLHSLSATGVQMNVQLPFNLTEGKYHFFIKTDFHDYIFEGRDENDNVSAYAGPVYVVNPDLKPLALQAPATAQTQQNITVSWLVENAGKGSVFNTAWNDAIYLSADTVVNAGDVLLGTVPNSAFLPAGNRYNKQQTVTLPEGIQGNYYLIVATDHGHALFEKNENNNQVHTPLNITLSPWPDLVITAVQPPATDTAGSTIVFYYSVKNSGTGRIENKTWRDRFYLSRTNNPADPNKLFLTDVTIQRTLDTGQTYTNTISVLLPATLSGQYYMIAVTDEGNAIFESTGESNNHRVSNAFSVSPFPNFDLAAVSGNINTASLTAGQTVSVEWTARNAGSSATVISAWEDAVYLSDNAILDGSDRLLGVWTIGTTLAPGATYSQLRTVTVPNDVSGTLYLLLHVDRTNQHNDINRGNNVLAIGTGSGSGSVVVTRPPPSDLLPFNLQAPAEGTSGQPFTLIYSVKNNGTGTTNAVQWKDRVYLSQDNQLDGNDVLIGTFDHTGSLTPGSQYTDTQQVFVPAHVSGNYILLLKTDAGNQVYEHEGEDNNLAVASFFIRQQPPCDLIVTQVSPPGGTQIAGQYVTASWTLQNRGSNPVKGYFRDAVYLSADTTWDAGDILFATRDTFINSLPQQATMNRQATERLANVAVGNYYIIVRTDILNNQLEIDEANNTGYASDVMPVDVKLLTIGTAVADTLFNTQALYYRVVVPALQKGETMLLTLSGNSVDNAVNNLYLRFDSVPSANRYDFASLIPFSVDQAIVVPELKEGTYYLLATVNGAKQQSITLLARIIPFEITTINASQGGNTGGVTVKISGAKFTATTAFKLHHNQLGTIRPSRVYYTDQTQVFATFNLLNAKMGFYNLVATQLNGDSTQLVNGFEVVQGPGSDADNGTGGGPGQGESFMCQVVNIGFDDGLDVGATHPASTRINQFITVTIYFENRGTVDIPSPARYFISLDKNVPVSFSLDELKTIVAQARPNYPTDLILEFTEAGGPPGILRPGASGFIKVYIWATIRGNLDFVIAE